ncbi:hypothetical protein CALVIDRAFT_151393 [Calocera viscosa TUFC12733]|uniref:Uncharacterized protein n=1 Tax=Calocera viscosa (strain TUFC12733) TaxID=1330018 RepID=A0A167LKI5_CALVF|nr:hypothetical protein CALVIDRAFT_151393 [Calocera viscosa TUFC12733]
MDGEIEHTSAAHAARSGRPISPAGMCFFRRAQQLDSPFIPRKPAEHAHTHGPLPLPPLPVAYPRAASNYSPGTTMLAHAQTTQFLPSEAHRCGATVLINSPCRTSLRIPSAGPALSQPSENKNVYPPSSPPSAFCAARQSSTWTWRAKGGQLRHHQIISARLAMGN